MELEEIKRNKVQMIMRFSIPSIIAMLLTSMITIADGFFIGNYVGSEGIAAVNLGLPIIYLYLALGLMMSVGGVALAGMALGAGNRETSNSIFNQTMLTTIAASIVVSAIVLVLFRPMLNILHAEGIVAEYFKQYYVVILLEMPLTVVNSSFGMFIRGEGNPSFFMKVSILNVIMNILLDYIFSKWLHLGVWGVAVASLIAAFISSLIIIYYFVSKSKVYKFHRFSFEKEVFANTIFNGSSEFIGEMSMSISMFAYNWVIMRNIGVDGVTAFTIVGYVAYAFSMIIIGFGQGASPLMSFTYGAKEKELSKNIRRKTNLFVFIGGLIVIAVMFVISGWYSGVFVNDSLIKNMIRSGIVIFTLSFLFSGVNTITSVYFTSIGKAMESAVISFSRGLVVLLICIFTLPVFFGMTGVWMVAPVTEIITLFISIFFIYREN